MSIGPASAPGSTECTQLVDGVPVRGRRHPVLPWL